MSFLRRSRSFEPKRKMRFVLRAPAHTKDEYKTATDAAEGRENMKNNDLYIGMGVGLGVGVVSALLMRPKKKDVKSAVARVIGDVADSVSRNMGR